MEESLAKSQETEKRDILSMITRVLTLIAVFLLFIPGANPTKINGLISRNISLFTAGVSYSSLTNGSERAIRMEWVNESTYQILYVMALLMLIGIALVAAGACMSLGNRKLKNLGSVFSVIGSAVAVAANLGVYPCYQQFCTSERLEKVEPSFPMGFYIFLVMDIILLVLSVVILIRQPKAEKGEKCSMEAKYRLFLLLLPFLMLAFVFSYLPLWGWRYAFFDYNSGETLSMDKFVGFKWFTYLFQNAATRRDIIQVMRNTLVMSGLNIATSWVPMFFAIFLNEIGSKKFRRFVQTVTTIPNFISWVLVYAIALAIFSTDGFINTFAMSMGWITEGTNYLMGNSFTWLKMLAWGMWKGVGWSAIIYIAGISGIDQQLYEAAIVDGAGRFQKMRYVTLPGLLPTYCVMLLMAVAGILSNGMDQYLVFSNATNSSTIRVLDLYVYQLGIVSGSIPLSTVVSMAKSIISVILLFSANGISKAIRGESIV
ncbi:MAG: ABC transporter permease subunit [Lachnospiraceae bacterium]|nr:ABC transporter permease subunit [Lachnospiraceae bacterium]